MCYLRRTNLPDSEASNISLWQEDGKKLFPAFKEKNSRLRIRKHSCQTPRESNCLGHLKRSLKKHLPAGRLYAGYFAYVLLFKIHKILQDGYH